MPTARLPIDAAHRAASSDAHAIGAVTGLSQSLLDMGRNVLGAGSRRPLMTFIDDDGQGTFPSKWQSIIEDTGVPVTVPLLTSLVGTSTFMTWADVAALRPLGVEFVSHSHDHTLMTTLSEADIVSRCIASQAALIAHGCQPNVLAYPGGAANAAVIATCRRFFRAAIGVGAGTLNTPPIATFGISRAPLADSTNNTLAIYKAKVDEAVAGNGWLVWMSHSQYASFDATQQGYIRDLIDYAVSLGVEIVNVNDALDYIGNVVEVGRVKTTEFFYPGDEYVVVDCDGKSYARSYSQQLLIEDTAITPSTIASYFAKNSVTRSSCSGTRATGLPGDKSGSLVTFRGISDDFAYQVYSPYDSNATYRRRWVVASSAWSAWEKITTTPTELAAATKYLVQTANYKPESAAITEFADGKITTFAVNGANPYNGKAGVVTVLRLQGNGWHRQELREWNSNRVYSRYVVDGTGAWSAWEKISAV